MLGTEPQIIEEYVNPGQVKIVFWPVIDFGSVSHDAQAAAHCIGMQSPDAFWQAHDQFFVNASSLYDGRPYFVTVAVELGVDQATFESCFDNNTGHLAVSQLDTIRRDAGITRRPTFDINGLVLFGSQPFETFAQAIDSQLP